MLKAAGAVLLVLVCSSAWAGKPSFLIKKVSNCPSGVYGGGFEVREVIHPRNDGVNPGFSTAYVTLKPHGRTVPHKLTKSSQVYFVVKGKAILHLGNRSFEVGPNTAIYIAPGVWQWAENRWDEPFAFICIVAPPWYKAEEVVSPVR